MIINKVAAEDGHISFNMAGFSFLPGSITEAEYNAVMSNPALRAITTFVGGRVTV